jgi:hypothetical protein
MQLATAHTVPNAAFLLNNANVATARQTNLEMLPMALGILRFFH